MKKMNCKSTIISINTVTGKTINTITQAVTHTITMTVTGNIMLDNHNLIGFSIAPYSIS